MHLLSEKLKSRIKEKLPFAILLVVLLAVASLLALLPVPQPASSAVVSPQAGVGVIASGDYKARIAYVSEEVNPSEGIQTKIVLGDAVPRMVALGIIDVAKIEALYNNRGGVPPEEMKLLTSTSSTALIVNADNATWLVNLLWPLGLANHLEVNNQSPIAGKDVGNYASTGGWSLGTAATGGGYFNKYPLIPLTPAQEKRVQQIAESTYRPCCDNSSFFQDCNHGSAAMGIIELGVSEGLSDADIDQTLLAFNSFWFPHNYVEIALYFNVVKNTDWKDVDPQVALSKQYSSLSSWMKNIDGPVQKIPGLIPQAGGGGSCGA